MSRYVDVNDVGATLRWREGASGDALARFPHLVQVAEQRIDNLCGRTFDLQGQATQRWFEMGYAEFEDGVEVNDFPHDTLREVVIRGTHPENPEGETTPLEAGDYQAEPIARLRNGQPWPADTIRLVRSSTPGNWWITNEHRFQTRRTGAYPYTSFPGRQDDVVAYLGVTARWGWPEVPRPVVEATVLMTNRMAARADSPLGMTGQAEYGFAYVRKNDPDIADLIEPYRKIRLM